VRRYILTNVLIVYGTRYGTTKEISDEIEKKIQEKGINTESYNLNNVNLNDIPPLDKFDGIILGTGIKIKKWTKEVKKFVKKRKSELEAMQNKMGFYVCCGEATKKDKISHAINNYITSKLEDIGLEPVLIDAFGGAYDLRDGSAVRGMTRKIVISIMQKEEGVENPEGKLHDFRDWEQIESFTNKFVNLLSI
jgi:menaquinone-dependent protoporphyrinogen oxidase